MTEFRRSLAVIIGINQYVNDIPPLETAVNDAKQLDEILRNKYQYKTLLLLDTDAILSRLNYLLTAFTQQKVPLSDGSEVKIDKSDRLLFYFAGHGIAKDALENADGPAGFLIPQDGQRDDGWLSMQTLHDALVQLPCRHMLIILDCCFAGTFRWATLNREAVRSQKLYQERYARYIKGNAQQVITSAAHDEKAADYLYRFGERGENHGHSPFAELLFKALDGEGDITNDGAIIATELYLYLDRELSKKIAKQTPGFCQLRGHDKGEYIFVLPGFDPKELPKAPPLDENTNPYKGLESFEEEDSHKFCGRKALTEELANFVTQHKLTVVLGASGAGKSSLVKAGLLPNLRKTQQWRILPPFRPGESPFNALNYALQQEKLPIFEMACQIRRPPTSGMTNSEDTSWYSQGLEKLYENLIEWRKHNSNSNLLLVIDQFEELIALSRNDTETNMLLSGLATAIETFPDWLRIVVTLRSDFEPQFRDTALEPYWTEARFVVRAMTREELRQAIVEPATAKVMYFEPPDLVERLIDEVVQMPGALPLLSFTLSELYWKYIKSAREETRNNRSITQEDYKELGGVAQSLTKRADWEYQQLVNLDNAYAKTIRHVMLRMVAIGGGELARRRVLDNELVYPEPENERVQQVIERFCAARLLVRGQDVEGNGYVEPAHDFLVRGWSKLLRWQQQDEGKLILQRQVMPAALEWQTRKQPTRVKRKVEPLLNWLERRFDIAENFFNKVIAKILRLWRKRPSLQKRPKKKQVEFLWDTSPYLDLLQKQLKSDQNWFNQLEAEFVRRSLQRQRNNLRRLVGSVIGIILALSALAAVAGYQWRQAEFKQIDTLSSSSTALLLGHQELEAVQEGLRAAKKMKHSFWQAFWSDRDVDNRLRSTLQKVLQGVHERNRLQVDSRMKAVAVSHDDQMIATHSLDNGAVQLWKPDGTLVPLPHNGRQVQLISSTNQRIYIPVVASSANDQIVALDVEGRLVLLFKTKDGAKHMFISAVAFHPTKKILALAARNRVVFLSLAENRLLSSLQGQRDAAIAAIGFSSNGKMLAAASTIVKINEKQKKTGIIQLWNLADGTAKTLQGDMNNLQQAVAIAPDGQMVAASGWYGTALFKSDGTWHKQLEGHSPVNAIAFSHDGKLLATASVDKTVKLWKKDGTLFNTLVGHSDAVWGVSFRPDDRIIASASNDNTVKLWYIDDQKNGTLLDTFAGHRAAVRALGFSHDGKKIASASDDWTVKLWQLGGSPLKALSHNDQVYAVAFSPDGQTIATGSGHGWVTLFNPDGTLQKTGQWDYGAVTAIAFSPNRQLIATASADRAVQLRKSDGTLLRSLEGHTGEIDRPEVFGVSFSPDSQTIVTAGADGTVELFNSGDGKLLRTLDRQRSIVWDVSFSPNGQAIASAHDDGTVKLFASNGKWLKTLSGHKGPVRAIAWSPDSQILASASGDKTVKLWTRDGKLLKTLSGHKEQLRAIAFSRDGTIASASADQTVKVWTRDGKLIKTLSGHEGAVVRVAFSPDGKTIASASDDRTVILWNWQENLDLDRLVEYSCEWVRDYLENNPNAKEDRHLCNSTRASRS